MKKIFFLFLFFPLGVFAVTIYPQNVSLNQNFSVVCDNEADYLGLYNANTGSRDFWSGSCADIDLSDINPTCTANECYFTRTFLDDNVPPPPPANLPIEVIWLETWTEVDGNDIEADREFAVHEERMIISEKLFSLSLSSTSDIMSSTGTLFKDLWVVLSIAMGLPIGFFVVRKVIGLF